jgi:hypothetical protein
MLRSESVSLLNSEPITGNYQLSAIRAGPETIQVVLSGDRRQTREPHGKAINSLTVVRDTSCRGMRLLPRSTLFVTVVGATRRMAFGSSPGHSMRVSGTRLRRPVLHSILATIAMAIARYWAGAEKDDPA